MTDTEPSLATKRKYNDLSLDLNLDQVTADEAWANYDNIKLKYTLEGEQLTWLACALYAACRRRSVPTVGGRPGNMIQGNCVSLTRMLQHCNLPLTEFIKKMKSWLAMSHFDEGFCRRVDLLERNFAVSNNIFKKYKPIFLDLFKNPANDLPRAPRSRKQRRPPCNSTELFHFCWTLYILIKGKYPSIPQDLVSCYSLLLASIDLIYRNVVLSNRKDLINPECEGVPADFLNSESSGNDLASWPVSIMDYLCEKFDGVLVETKVVREYYWNKHIRDLIDKKVLKGGAEGTALLEQANFDHNVKEVKNAYEEYLLSYGEFDERMFLNEDEVVTGSIGASPPSTRAAHLESPVDSSSMRQARRNLVQSFDGDLHLVPLTPITGRRYTINRPNIGTTPLTVVTSGLQKLYALLAGRKNSPSEELQEMFKTCKENPEEKIAALVADMSEEFCRLYTQSTEDYNGPSMDFAKMRLQMGQILYYTFLEHILMDEKRRGVDLMLILQEEMFHKTLFTCCLEIVLRSYNDPRRFPWSLQVGQVEPYYFIRIIEPVIRSEKQSDNQLSRELVKHLKGIEEQILDSLAWKGDSSLWQILQNGDIPSCQDVNFSDQLETEMNSTTPSVGLATTPMSPAAKLFSDKATPINLQLSPLSTISERFQSPMSQSSARRTLFPPSTTTTTINNPVPTLTVSKSSLLNRGTTGTSVVTTSAPSNIQKTPNLITVQGATRTADTNAENNSEKTADPPSTDKKKDRPKRHGSLALFCRKFYTLANMRLRELCDRLDVNEKELRKKIWTCFEHSIIHYTELMQDRHMDQMIMCAIYITCKVTGNDRIFQEIMKHYRSQPQAASHVYRSVLISRSNTPSQVKYEGSKGQQGGSAPPATPNQMTGTSTSFDQEERGDLIKFYNQVYVQRMKAFALKFRAALEGDLPPLSPLPVVRHTPVSPRRRISSNHSVYINNLSPVKGSTAMSPRKPLPYYFNRSPAKDLMVINNMLKTKVMGAKRMLAEKDFVGLELKRPLMSGMCRRIQGVMGDRLSGTPTLDLQQDSDGTPETSSLPQNGHAAEPSSEDYSSADQP
ncbi:retinoblastoma-like protein 1 [Eriocheir sinensis]|uniref:retinoblastoma-like protein 1 n=1 Tax=Eriocheir sinensis TaxID=95602 RepID=UPI0021C8D976|nr:retinoblastoma-like protein 1 [Eriocheir sinensis]